MEIKKYNKTLVSLKERVKFDFIIITALLLITLMQAFKLLNTKETVVVLPPTFNEEIRVSGNKANSGFAKSWALYFSVLIGNVAPKTADFTTDSLLKYMVPTLEQKASAVIGSGIQALKDKTITRIFTPSGVLYEPVSNKAFVTGESISFNNVGKRSSDGQQTYEYIIEIKNGYPTIVGFNAYSGRPRTQDVLQRMKHLQEMKDGTK